MEQTINERNKVWFTSDTHVGHSSILYFHPKRRDAAGITLEELQEDKAAALEKHDAWLMDKWNRTVKKSDSIYLLGDFSFKNREATEKFLSRLNGKKYLIRGNHDKSLNGLERYFEWVGDIKEVKFTNNQFKFIDPNESFCVELCHFPMLTWNRRTHGSLHVHGHCHGHIDEVNVASNELRVDVGLDSTLSNYDFVELETLYNYFCSIRDNAGCSTFQEYADKLMSRQGFRM